MAGLLLAPLGAVLLGVLLGGSLAGWAHCRVRWWMLALACLAVQLVLFTPPVDMHPLAIAYGPWIWTLTLAGTTAALVRNAVAERHWISPWGLAALGAALNLLVIAANGGVMPQSQEARVAARGEALPSQESEPRLRNVAPMDEHTRFPWLGDVFAQPSWVPRSSVVSIGDFLLAGGLSWWAFVVTRGGARRLSAPARSGG